MDYFKQMQARGMTPDVKTFNKALVACAEQNQLNRALSLFDRMFAMGVQPDVACFNVLLTACGKEGKVEEIEALITQMPQMKVEPNIVNYNTAVRALAASGDAAALRRVMDIMRERGFYGETRQPQFSTLKGAILSSADSG